MKAKIEVNEAIIKKALLKYFANMDASSVTLRSQSNEDWYGNTAAPIISATVEIEVESEAY